MLPYNINESILLSKSQLVLYSSLLITICYIVYARFLHPIAKYPGPFLASLTNFYKCFYIYDLSFHEKLVELHEQYGPVVRVGPNHLHFWNAEAIAPIYKSGKSVGKTEFYGAFTTYNPNLFGGRDEGVGLSISPLLEGKKIRNAVD